MALYSTLAELGYIEISELYKQGSNGSLLTAQTSHKVPGVQYSSGSLGMGLSVGVGVALAKKRMESVANVYVLVGDGECNEGSIWEAAMLAGQHKLCNLTVIIDHNKLQANDYCANINNWENIHLQWESFGWHVQECDGHNVAELKRCFQQNHEKPICIIAHTVKGKGIRFMENNKLWHYSSPTAEEYEKARAELGG